MEGRGKIGLFVNHSLLLHLANLVLEFQERGARWKPSEWEEKGGAEGGRREIVRRSVRGRARRISPFPISLIPFSVPLSLYLSLSLPSPPPLFRIDRSTRMRTEEGRREAYLSNDASSREIPRDVSHENAISRQLFCCSTKETRATSGNSFHRSIDSPKSRRSPRV